MISSTLLLVVFIILIALVFDFTNGIHDSANSIATIVSTRVLTPRQAVAWAAFFNFIAFLIFGTSVASTVGKGLVDIKEITPVVVLAGLLGAITWNLITWYLAIPSSSSHALIGGLLGAAIAHAYFKLGEAYELILKIMSDSDLREFKRLIEYFKTLAESGVTPLVEKQLIMWLDRVINFFSHVTITSLRSSRSPDLEANGRWSPDQQKKILATV